jgi:hypothetical protein
MKLINEYYISNGVEIRYRIFFLCYKNFFEFDGGSE